MKKILALAIIISLQHIAYSQTCYEIINNQKVWIDCTTLEPLVVQPAKKQVQQKVIINNYYNYRVAPNNNTYDTNRRYYVPGRGFVNRFEAEYFLNLNQYKAHRYHHPQHGLIWYLLFGYY